MDLADAQNFKLVIAVASTALFDLRPAADLLQRDGLRAYRAHQRALERVPLEPGSAFPLVSRLLTLNRVFGRIRQLVDVVLVSRHDPDSGVRILDSVAAHRLPIGRAIFTSGGNPSRYAQAVGASLFLSTNVQDVREGLACGVPSGCTYATGFEDDIADEELRIAFDFDGVLADDESETIYQTDGLDAFQESERRRAAEPLREGPLASFCRQLGRLRHMLSGSSTASGHGRSGIRTSIVTSRGAPAHTRVVTTLRSWGMSVDDAFFLGGLPKGPVLSELEPHIFFDDQLAHIQGVAATAPCAHVPFGIANRLVSAAPASLQ